MKKRKINIIIWVFISAILICSVVGVAAVLFKSYVKTQGNLTANDIDKVVDVNDATKNNLEVDVETEELTFEKAGDSQTFTVKVNNNTKSVIEYQYEFSFDSETILQTKSFASAILVYFNGEFVDTLGNLCANDEKKVESGYINFKGFVNASQPSTNESTITYTSSSQTDEITFKLHSAADGSIFDDDTKLTFNLKTYAKTADYTDYIYVSNKADLLNAFDDINTGLLKSDVTIVLFNDITLNTASTISYPCQIDLNGHVLLINSNLEINASGNVILKTSRKINANSITNNSNISLDNSEGILEIRDLYNKTGNNLASSYSNIVDLKNYNHTLAQNLILSYIKDKVKYGMDQSTTLDIPGGLSCYSTETSSIKVSDNLIYSSNKITAKELTNTSEEYIIFNEQKIGVKVYGSDEAATLESLFNESGELYYLTKLAQTTDGEITTTTSADLFLPTAFKDKNITVEWKSNNLEYLSDEGLIQSNVNNGTEVSITGYFTINNKVLTKTLSIKISSQNHDTIFQYFIAQLSPITIEKIYTGSNANYAYYYLPIVNSDSKYHYTKSYNTPYNEDSSSTETGYTWLGFNDVAFEKLTYSQISTYNFISLDQNAKDMNGNSGVAVYLDSATFETYAQINLVGKFTNDDELYSGNVNIIINPGYNSELNELVFEKTESDLNTVDVLQNILDTRKENNMLNEKGDFTLDGTYNSYLIQYVIPESSKDAISCVIGYSDEGCENEVARISGTYTYSESDSTQWTNMFTVDQMKQIVKYKICLNPEGFNLNESDFAVNVVLVMPTSDNELHTAARYQYFTCPGVIKCDTDGFSNMSVFNSVKYQVWTELKNLSNESYNSDSRDDDYTKASDTSSFTISGSLLTNHTGAYILRHDAYLCDTLAFDLTETNTNTDNHIIYGLSRLIDWATGDTTDTINKHFPNTLYLDSSFKTTYGSYSSDGNSYLTDSEESVLKAYYQTYIKTSLSDIEWETLIDNVSYQVKDSNGNAKYVITNYSGLQSAVLAYWTDTSKYGSNYDYGTSGKSASYMFGKWNDGLICWAYNTRDIGDHAGSPACYGTYDWTGLVDGDYTSWSSTNTGYNSSKYYNNSNYVTDNTSYISIYELEVMMAFMINTKSGNTSTTSGTSEDALKEVQNIRDNYFAKPRYFNSDGIGSLISKAYEDLGKSLSGNATTGFTSELSSFTTAHQEFLTPHVTLMDNSLNALDYFTNLTTLYIHGDTDTSYERGSLSAFHLDNTLSQVFNRLINSNSKLINLGLEYCSNATMSFEIDNIYKLENLERISLCDNKAISNIGALLKLNLSQLTYVNVANIDLLNKYSSFTLSAINLKASSPFVYYSKDGSTTAVRYYDTLNSNAAGLIYLEEFYSLLSENAQLAQYTFDGTNQENVQWSIEEGNDITYIDSSKTSSINSIDYPYTNYYFVTQDFTYNNFTFVTNHLYKIYSSNSSVAFEEVKDDNGNAIELLESEPSDTLTEEEKKAALNGLSKSNIEENGEYTLITTGSFNSVTINSNSNYTPSNGRNIYGSSSTTQSCVFYDSDKKIINQYSDCYSFGYLPNNSLSRTLTYQKEEDTLTNAISTSVSKYYYVLESNHYNIYKKTYRIDIADSITSTIYTREDSETFRCWYVASSRSGKRNYTYSFVNLLGLFPKIRYIEFNGTTYDIYDTNYGYKKTEGTETSASTTESNVNNVSLQTKIRYSAMIATTSLSSAVNSINKTLSISNGVTYYNDGSSKIIQSGIYIITLGSNGFEYTSQTSSTAIQNAKYMDDLLNTANSHLTDSYFGLYYHKYYAYGGGSAVYNGFSYTQYAVYYLDINSSGKFYWAIVKDGTGQQVLYETKSGDYSDIDTLIASVSSADLNKVYYFTGTRSDTFRQGTGVWYHVVYDEDNNAYNLVRFGVVSEHYLYYDTSGNQNTKTVDANSDKLNTICNLVEYMDTYTFTTGVATTPYDRLIGGTYKAVLKATIIVDDVKYERLFVIEVTG